MNGKLVILLLMTLLLSTFAQGDIKPYPGDAGTQPAPSQPLIPPLVSQAILIVGGIIVFCGFFLALFFVLLIVLRLIFPPKKLPDSEVVRRNRISDCKGWGGTNLYLVQLAGDSKSVPTSILGFCSGFKAEGKFNYITYHTGMPSYFFVLKRLKGSNFQLHIPFIDITIPPDHIIQIEPDLHSVPGKTIVIYSSGIMLGNSDYEIPNTSSVLMHERMEIERNELIARAHGVTASHTRELAETFWESKPEHFKKRDAESNRVPAGK